MKWELPAKIFENGLVEFLSDVARFDQSDEPITIDFHSVTHWIPAPIVYLCAIVNRWVERNRSVCFVNHQTCQAFRYLQRIDFFERVGLRLPEDFQRHPGGTNFVEIAVIPDGPARLVDSLSQRLAACLAGNNSGLDDVRQLAEFSLGEVIANVQQHAKSTGFCSAQFVLMRDWARLVVADAGIGILSSFRDTASPHYYPGMTDSQALQLAFQPWVSSRKHIRVGPYGEPSNRGVGLNMIQLMLASSCGELVVASGSAFVHYQGERHPVWQNLQYPIPGTLVSIMFPRTLVPEYRQLLADAHNAINSGSSEADDGYFV